MAGSYPDAPNRRMGLDADGSILVAMNAQSNGSPGGPVTEIGGTNKTNSQDEQFDLNCYNQLLASSDAVIGWIFPELREVDGIFMSSGLANNTGNTVDVVWTSGDTTDFITGTWTQRIANYVDPAHNSIAYRQSITSLAISNVRSVSARMQGGSFGRQSMQKYMLYGEISAGQTPDRLLWIDEITGLEFNLPLDYGDVPRGSARDREVRIKNNSGSLTANTIQITAEDLYLGSAAWYTFDIAGGGFASTRQIASLGSGATSGLITIRQIVPDATTLGVNSARAYANVSSWT